MDKKKLNIVSKGSIIGLIIKIVVFSIIAINISSTFDNPKIILYIIIAIFAYFLYGFFTDKTIINIDDQKFSITVVKGLPKKEEIFSYEINRITAVKLVQTSNFIYGKKSIFIYDNEGDNDEILVSLRYYQLVQIEDYLNNEMHIKADLIG